MLFGLCSLGATLVPGSATLMFTIAVVVTAIVSIIAIRHAAKPPRV